MANQFTDSFMGVPRADSPLGAGDVAIRGLKDAIRGVFNREFTGFGATLDPTKQGYLRQGSSKIWVWNGADDPLVRPDGSALSVDDVGRQMIKIIPSTGQRIKYVYMSIGSAHFWAREPEGIVAELRMYASLTPWVDPNLTSWQLALTTGTMPGWFKADGSEITIPAPGGNTIVTLPNLTDAYPKFGTADEAAGSATGEHTRTLSSANLPEHTHTIDAFDVTTNTTGAHTHTYARPGGGIFWTSAGVGLGNYASTETSSAGDHSHTVSIPQKTTSAVGSGTPVNIEPRRFVVVPIIRVY